MNMRTGSKVSLLLHDAVARRFLPGEEFARALDWCEEYIDRELAFDADQDDPRAAVTDAIGAYLQEREENPS